MNICPVCQKRPAKKHKLYGLLPCSPCQKIRDNQLGPARQIEFASESIKGERRSMAKSILQPYRSGVLSKEYVDAFGFKNINPSPDDIRKMKPVWTEDYGSNFDVTKTK